MHEISKAFLGVPVLRSVELTVGAGEVHALIGENGAGKTTLMNILGGVYLPDSGTMAIDGQVVRLHHPQEARQHGIILVHQELNLLPARTVQDNIFLGWEPSHRGILDRRTERDEVLRALSTLDQHSGIAPNSLIRDLSVAQQQTVEIAKSLLGDARIVVLDEPTASLAPSEVESLFTQIRKLRARGLAVIYISHRMSEVFEVADRITVLKDGVHITTLPAAQMTSLDLVRLMVGRELNTYYPPRARPDSVGEICVSVSDGSNQKLRAINFDVRQGEIVGLTGLEGCGRIELARALFGWKPFTRGQVTLDGKPARLRTPKDAMARGVALLTEDRKSEGLALTRTIRENILLPTRALGRRLRRSRGIEPVSPSQLASQVELRGASLDTEAQVLSGGNQQKVVLAKWLALKPRFLIFSEPTRGIDVGGKAALYALMRELTEQGTAVLMISSDLPEVIGMSDRVLVMRDGTIVGELGANCTEEQVMLLAAGQTAGVLP
jgi:ribose transport system ATP-binding protein